MNNTNKDLFEKSAESTSVRPGNSYKSDFKFMLPRKKEETRFSLLRCWSSLQCPAGRVFQHRVGSGRVLDKIPGSGSGSGRVGVSKNTIGYFRVSFLLSGISGYFGYFRVCRVFSGISGFTTRVIF